MGSKTIELTRGKSTLVDEEDFEFLSQWKWLAHRSLNDIWYAVRNEGGRHVFMHNVLLDIESPAEADHRNHDGLDNRRNNLRPCTRTQNQQNRRGWSRKNARRSSAFKGVSWDFRKGKSPRVRACIYVNGTVIRKRFNEEETAARWYDEMARLHFGEFALTNFAEAV